MTSRCESGAVLSLLCAAQAASQVVSPMAVIQQGGMCCRFLRVPLPAVAGWGLVAASISGTPTRSGNRQRTSTFFAAGGNRGAGEAKGSGVSCFYVENCEINYFYVKKIDFLLQMLTFIL